MRRWVAMVALITALAGGVIAVVLGSGGAPPTGDPPAGTDPGLSKLPRGLCDSVPRVGNGAVPPACWRPYAMSSPFNRRLPSEPRLHPRSEQIVDRVIDFGPAQNLRAGQAGREDDFGQPTYYSEADDPVFTVRCLMPWGRCEIEGARVRIPDAARVPGGSDGHITVVDRRSGWEYDMWRAGDKPRGGGELTIAWGGRTRIDGDGLGSDAVAAQFGNLAGKLRAEELLAGRIDHALFMVVTCDSGEFVYPAGKTGQTCDTIGQPNQDAPPMGAHFMLDMTPSEIERLDVPPWKRTILNALAEYGMFLGDTGGRWALREESGLSQTSFGRPDPWVEVAERFDAPYFAPDRNWILELESDVDWAGRLRVVDPCVSRGSC